MSTLELTPMQATLWLREAVADGWKAEPLYPNHERTEWAARLTRDGWTAHVFNRPERVLSWGSKAPREAKVTVWGPDDLQIDTPPVEYDWSALVAGLKVCSYCKRTVDKTIRIGFAGRTCSPCHAKHVAQVEYPGWCD